MLAFDAHLVVFRQFQNILHFLPVKPIVVRKSPLRVSDVVCSLLQHVTSLTTVRINVSIDFDRTKGNLILCRQTDLHLFLSRPHPSTLHSQRGLSAQQRSRDHCKKSTWARVLSLVFVFIGPDSVFGGCTWERTHGFAILLPWTATVLLHDLRYLIPIEVVVLREDDGWIANPILTGRHGAVPRQFFVVSGLVPRCLFIRNFMLFLCCLLLHVGFSQPADSHVQLLLVIFLFLILILILADVKLAGVDVLPKVLLLEVFARDDFHVPKRHEPLFGPAHLHLNISRPDTTHVLQVVAHAQRFQGGHHNHAAIDEVTVLIVVEEFPIARRRMEGHRLVIAYVYNTIL
mmetsp:Transcript_18083/g.31478  ORF Transcript_18083/g.31478 Transcript_18083/m.31478 type:complete len:345 (+) Transcript_18083:1849-2883(+)